MELTPQNPKKQQPQSNPYLKYSGVAFQMLFTIVLFGFGGYWLDKTWHTDLPICTGIFLLLGTIVSIVSLIRQLNKEQN